MFSIGQTFKKFNNDAHVWARNNGAMIIFDEKKMEYVIVDDGKSKAEKEAERIERELLAAKTERAEAVEKITVKVGGMVFDGDEVSQQRIARSILALEDGEAMSWVLHNNKVASVTKEQLKQVLRLAGERMTELWVVPYK